MQRTTIMADERLLYDLRTQAQRRGISLAALIREALEDKAGETQPRPRSGGIASSGHHDTARASAERRPEPRAWR